MFDNETLEALGDVLKQIDQAIRQNSGVTIDEHEVVTREGRAILEFTTNEGRQYQVIIVQTNADEEAVDEEV